MKRTGPYAIVLSMLILAGFLLSGCNLMSLLYPEATPTVIPTPTAEPLKEISVCLGYEPRSLFPYRAASAVENEVLWALTDKVVEVLPTGEVDPAILAKLPEPADGSVVSTPVAVTAGDAVVNSAGSLVALEAGVSVFPSGCTSSDCVVSWDGVSPLQIDQTRVIFDLKEGMQWSDGEPVTAEDSVFAFELAADPEIPLEKSRIDMTDSYTAIDAQTVEWMGMPGIVAEDFTLFFWIPQPAHLWKDMDVGSLLADESANRNPTGFGPFMVEEWVAGSHIRLVKNPNYHRADEGLPAVDILTFKFLSAADSPSLLTAASAECDLVSPSALDLDNIQYLQENANSAGMQLVDVAPASVEILAFGITPSSYDDNYYPYGADRPDFFGDIRVRQAITACIDKPTLVNKLVGGGVESASSLLSSNHPLFSNNSLDTYTFNPTQGVTLLQQAGWMDADFNPETPLTAVSVPNIPFGVAFEIDLLTTQSALRGEMAAEITTQLSSCGIGVNIVQMPASELYQPGPDGPLYGRNFDLALLSLQTGGDFDCRIFQSNEMPNEANYWLGETTGGANFSGYRSEAYDAACRTSIQSGADMEKAVNAAGEALRILNEDLPFVPIFHYPSAFLRGSEVCMPESSSTSGYRENISQVWTGSGCQNP